MKIGLDLILFLVLLSGCAASPPVSNANNNPIVNDNSTNGLLPPSEPLVYCDSLDLVQNEKCFETALLQCGPSVGRFWKTTDEFSLIFETLGVTPEEKCEVRVTVPSDSESEFKGQTATCLLEKKPLLSDESTLVFDVYDISPSNCSGTYAVSLQQKEADSSGQQDQ